MDDKDKYQGKVSKDPHFGSEWSFTDEQLRSFAAEHGLAMPKLPDGWYLEGEQHDCDDEGTRPPVVMAYLRFRDFDPGVFVMLGEKAPYCFPDESEFFDIMSQSETLDEYIANTRSLAALLASGGSTCPGMTLARKRGLPRTGSARTTTTT